MNTGQYGSAIGSLRNALIPSESPTSHLCFHHGLRWPRQSHAKLLKTALIAAWQNTGNPHMEMPPHVNTPSNSSAWIIIIHFNPSGDPPPQPFAELEHSVQYFASSGGGISQIQSVVHIKIWSTSADRNDKIKPCEAVNQRTVLVFINWL